MGNKTDLANIWHSNQVIKQYPLAITDISLNYILEILRERRYLESDIYRDTLSIFAELIFRISEKPDILEQFLDCFNKINAIDPIRNNDFDINQQ